MKDEEIWELLSLLTIDYYPQKSKAVIDFFGITKLSFTAKFKEQIPEKAFKFMKNYLARNKHLFSFLNDN